MSSWLAELPFQALTAIQKGSILEFLCNELLCSHQLTGEIEKNIESINNLRRDKWIIEGKLRKLRMIRAKRFRKSATSKLHTTTATGSPVAGVSTGMGDDGLPMSKRCSDDDEDNESANESDAASTPGNMSEAEV
ncbi:Bromodomain adjacent to zinc finger domain protein 2B [Lamellibrachia satsuma]|nr:Bromodomain adjacent to zinc finger domain protein 2B [Lamellibrachia satsuma]